MQNKRLFQLTGFAIITLIVMFTIKHYKSLYLEYKSKYEFEFKQNEVLEQSLKELEKKNKLLQNQVEILKNQVKRFKQINKDKEIEKAKIDKLVPKHKARISYDEQKKVINEINFILSDF
jgi:uncharacterized protein YlxW (UPF0749 family)